MIKTHNHKRMDERKKERKNGQDMEKDGLLKFIIYEEGEEEVPYASFNKTSEKGQPFENLPGFTLNIFIYIYSLIIQFMYRRRMFNLPLQGFFRPI